jgi:hypothetical protein
MDNTQTDRLLNLIERYVLVEEAKLRIGLDQLAVRNKLDERAVAAQEHTATSGMKVHADMKASINRPQDEPT